MKTTLLSLLLSGFFLALLDAQNLNLLSGLNNNLQESSGLIYIQNVLISHNDSGSEPELYELDPTNGSVSRTVVLANASNIDWEDVAFDDNYIYIGDFGNNNGSRSDLKIYRIDLNSYWNTPNDTVYADTISFNYGDQQSFNPSPFSTNFDAEALVALDNQLLLFSKNWGNQWTKVYAIPKQPGNYTLQVIDSLNVGSFITGACSSSVDSKLYLIGYDFSTAYFYQWEYPNFDDSALHKYSLNIPSGYSYQIEGLSNADSSKFYISSEALGTSLSALYLFDFELLSSLHHLNKEPSFIFPNPASEWIEIKQENASSFEVYNLSGQLVLQSNTAIFSVSMLELGCYAILSKDKQGQILGKDILLLKK